MGGAHNSRASPQIRAMSEAQAVDNNWRGRVWDVLSRHTNEDGDCPRFCCDDHDDHIHMIFRCRCPRNCPPSNYRINCTVEMLCDIVPRENMHIHPFEPEKNPASPETILDLPRKTWPRGRKDEDGCAVCHELFEPGDEMTALPCGHHYHRACIVPWLEMQNTCPTCRFELPAAGKKQTVKIGEGSEVAARLGDELAVDEDEDSPTALEAFLGA